MRCLLSLLTLSFLLAAGCSESTQPSADSGFDGGPSFGDASDGGPFVDTRLVDTGVDAGPPLCDSINLPDTCVIAPAPLRILPADVIANLLRDVVGLEVELSFRADVFHGPFGTFSRLASLQTEQLVAVADEFARLATDLLDACEGDLVCREGGALLLIESLWRRDLVVAEQDSLRAAISTREGLTAAMRETVLAPDFVFIYEASEDGTVSRRDRVLRFAIGLLRWFPEPALLDSFAASAASLETMLESARLDDGLAHFHATLLDTTSLSREPPDVYPRMLEEQSAFVQYVVKDAGEPTFEELFSASYAFVDDTLAIHYGLDERPGGELSRVELAAPRAGGLLTQGAFTTGRGRIARRGLTIATDVLCRPLPPPPPDIPIEPIVPGAGTEREQWERAVTDMPACQGCHSRIDDFAFGLLNYDDEGRYQESEEGEAVDASFDGLCFGNEDVPPQGEGAVALVQWIATSDEAHDCYGRQWNRYIAAGAFDACTADIIAHERGDSIQDLLQRSFDDDALHPADSRRRSVMAPYEFGADNSVVSSLDAASRRVQAFRASTGVEEDVQAFDIYVDSLRELAARLGAI